MGKTCGGMKAEFVKVAQAGKGAEVELARACGGVLKFVNMKIGIEKDVLAPKSGEPGHACRDEVERGTGNTGKVKGSRLAEEGEIANERLK